MSYINYNELQILRSNDVRSIEELGSLIVELFTNGQPTKGKEILDDLFLSSSAPVIMCIMNYLVQNMRGDIVRRLNDMYFNSAEKWFGCQRINKPKAFDDNRGEYQFIY